MSLYLFLIGCCLHCFTPAATLHSHHWVDVTVYPCCKSKEPVCTCVRSTSLRGMCRVAAVVMGDDCLLLRPPALETVVGSLLSWTTGKGSRVRHDGPPTPHLYTTVTTRLPSQVRRDQRGETNALFVLLSAPLPSIPPGTFGMLSVPLRLLDVTDVMKLCGFIKVTVDNMNHAKKLLQDSHRFKSHFKSLPLKVNLLCILWRSVPLNYRPLLGALSALLKRWRRASKLLSLFNIAWLYE